MLKQQVLRVLGWHTYKGPSSFICGRLVREGRIGWLDRRYSFVINSSLFGVGRCPPCRAFTPRLVQTYKELKKRAGGADLEFIFVSSDKDQAQFDE